MLLFSNHLSTTNSIKFFNVIKTIAVQKEEKQPGKAGNKKMENKKIQFSVYRVETIDV